MLCGLVKLQNEDASNIIAIGSGPPLSQDKWSEDVLYFTEELWTEEAKRLTIRFQHATKTKIDQTMLDIRTMEYPIFNAERDLHADLPATKKKFSSRNSRCSCGSGLKFKNCCGRGFNQIS